MADRSGWGLRVRSELYAEHYRALVRLAMLLVADMATAEEVVQDSYVALHLSRRRLADNGKASAYLRQTVVNRSRSVLRHRVPAGRPGPPPLGMPAAEQDAMTALGGTDVMTALHTLPQRQREALVLRHYAELSEVQTAAAMGVSRGAVRRHTALGMAALRDVLEHTA